VLVDADCYGGTVAQQLGLVEDAPGLPTAIRAANLGTLDTSVLAGLMRAVTVAGGELRLLTGILRAQRWPELAPPALDAVLQELREMSPTIIVDVGFCLERDEELSFDLPVPRRNGSTLAVLESADTVLAVGAADPVGLARLIRGLSELEAAVPTVTPAVVVNRLRGSVVAGNPAREVTELLVRHTGRQPVALLPEDRMALDFAVSRGVALAESAAKTPLRAALAALADRLGRVAVTA
jgi:Flp pilus assembly CpaE family ATPase